MTAGPSQLHSPLRILIVDDHMDSARTLARLFRHEGHLVITAHSVTGALALLVGQQPIDVVVSDIGLPDGDGCELLRKLRTFYGGRDVPAVAMTGHGDDKWIEDCREAGYKAFLMKPVTFEQVTSAVRALYAGPPAAALVNPQTAGADAPVSPSRPAPLPTE